MMSSGLASELNAFFLFKFFDQLLIPEFVIFIILLVVKVYLPVDNILCLKNNVKTAPFVLLVAALHHWHLMHLEEEFFL